MIATADYLPACGLIQAVATSADALRNASRIPGAKRAGPLAWNFPASLDTCEHLQGQGVVFTEQLERWATLLRKISRYVEKMKRADTAEPLRPIPIKAPYQLYTHQIKAYNIALALFKAWSAPKGEAGT